MNSSFSCLSFLSAGRVRVWRLMVAELPISQHLWINRFSCPLRDWDRRLWCLGMFLHAISVTGTSVNCLEVCLGLQPGGGAGCDLWPGLHPRQSAAPATRSHIHFGCHLIFCGGNCDWMNLDSGVTAHHCTVLLFETKVSLAQPGLQLTV